MTSHELRRRADHLRRIAASRDRAAGVLVGLARSIAWSSAPLVQRSRAAWAGRAASGFEEHIRRHRLRLDDVLDDFRAAVNRLFSDVDRLLTEARALEARADALDLESAAPGAP